MSTKSGVTLQKNGKIGGNGIFARSVAPLIVRLADNPCITRIIPGHVVPFGCTKQTMRIRPVKGGLQVVMKLAGEQQELYVHAPDAVAAERAIQDVWKQLQL